MAQQNTRKKATTASQWRAKSKGEPVAMPSGNTALLRKPDLREFLAKGRVPDSLQPIVRAAISGKSVEKIREEETARVEGDDQALTDYLDFMDKIVLISVVEPEVSPIPTRVVNPEAEEEDQTEEETPLKDRDQSQLYVDEIDFDDKVAIFEWAVGGHTDLTTFRGEEEESVGS